MFEAFGSFFRAFNHLFMAAEKGAKSLDNVASVAEFKSQLYAEKEKQKLLQLASDQAKVIEAVK